MSRKNSGNQLIETRDGSHTVYSSQFDQHYHNPNGAVAESRYVFFEQTGLPEALSKQKDITILELGFGTGLNLMLLLDYYLSRQSEAHIRYYTIEAFPLKADLVQQFNYEDYLTHPQIARKVIALFDKLQKGLNHFTLLDNIDIYLFNGFFSDFNPDDSIRADYIFHDAFSPDTNPDLWTGKVFETLARHSHPNVMLSTYCAASKVQGAMAWAGWKIAKAQGALGKREMIVASLSDEPLSHLERINEERLARRYKEGDF
ncbi:tRNA (5-methylaminomethyl-2-thiouridine)(34)-methyltransferase MnmD [Aliifodinibius salicampi]|uniref:tRNA (5-methylaminomethyl-2-thiouridine)(34)-methyltransferase MnmD n=1 Tax=Fodinibius salicampi TaxID=1920655 RepID=A0ABT3PYM1_9BACT|nr:tRNA (5-methylaminomethyl-2-thiouridine)(34)-methyltransferase MnmD [Fodinibius salicampi]MCW9712954.1 tRNA (5-methylaminomethyl-2-thiouridine)(34)-methyltransferase MnmD [Fodinibius salicampi]